MVALVTMGQVMKFSVKGSGRTNYTRAATEIAHPSPAVNLTGLLEPFRLWQLKKTKSEHLVQRTLQIFLNFYLASCTFNKKNLFFQRQYECNRRG